MYDTEEEIKRRRRRLIIIIGIVSLLIVLLIIFLLAKNFISKKSKANDITCTLEVKNGAVPNSNGVYNKEVEVGFRDISATENYEITKQTVGTTDSSNNSDTYLITNSGNYVLYGFVEDIEGNKTTCEINVVVSMTTPSCSLEVKTGTLSNDSWYKTNVEVAFKSMETNNATLSIAKYYITKDISSSYESNMSSYTITDNGETTLTGIVVDSAGGIGTCNISVKKDTTIPTCTLVANGTKNSNGEYTDNPVISFGSFGDDISSVAEKGIGTSKNYKNQTVTISNTGKTTVYGYVKDVVGNEGTCSIEVSKAAKEGTKPTPTPTPEVKKSSSTCNLDVAYSGTKNNNTIYSTSDVLINLIPKTTNDATIVEYSLSIDGGKTYVKNPGKYSTKIMQADGEKDFQYVSKLVNNGTYYVKGYVKDSYGNTGYCPSKSGSDSSLTVIVKK